MVHTDSGLSSKLLELRAQVEQLTETQIAPKASQVDEECLWPEHSLKALASAGLLGLHVPESLEGQGQGLLALSLLTEVIGKACPSSALCFGMHCVGTAVIASKATPFQQQKYLRPIAQGKHITTLALSEAGSGIHLYLPETHLAEDDGHFIVNGVKQFITNGSYADSYVLSTVATGIDTEIGDFSCLILDRETPGMEWLAPWKGFGMRGNSSRGLALNNVRVSKEQLLGEEGDQVWYVFEVVTPYFLTAMASTYLGIAQSALEAAEQHLKNRRHSYFEEPLANVGTLQNLYGEMWLAVVKTRSLLRKAASLADRGDPDALPYLLASKADAGETAVKVTNDAMTICGGRAYQENSRVAQMLRDARASHVMSPTTDLLRNWLGKSLLGLPLL